MADDARREDEEFKITVRDRRRVTAEGELRQVEEPDGGPAAPPRPAPPPPVAAVPPPEPAPQPAPPPRREPPPERPARGSALGGAEQARVRAEEPRLMEVPLEDVLEEDDEDYPGEPGEPRQPRDLYEYTQMIALGMIEWAVSATGLTPNPLTRIVTVDMEQAEFGIEAAERLYGLLVETGKMSTDQRIGFCQSYVINFGQLAAQLLQQPPGVRLQEMGKVRFCIDTADQFMQKLRQIPDAGEKAQIQELGAFLSEVRLHYVQLSGGGGIVG